MKTIYRSDILPSLESYPSSPTWRWFIGGSQSPQPWFNCSLLLKHILLAFYMVIVPAITDMRIRPLRLYRQSLGLKEKTSRSLPLHATPRELRRGSFRVIYKALTRTVIVGGFQPDRYRLTMSCRKRRFHILCSPSRVFIFSLLTKLLIPSML